MELMVRALPHYDIGLLFFALMSTHYHVTAIQHKAYEVSWFLQQVSWRYAKAFNRRYRRYGPVFAGRFSPEIVQDDAGLLRLSYYVHMNPVKARLCRDAESWPYSSCAAYVGNNGSALVTRDPILKLVGGPDEYRRFLAEYNPADPMSVHRFIKGSDWTK
jgi:putative transposase